MVGWVDPNDAQRRVLPASAHPLVLRAEAEAESELTLWRMHYQMPPTDPRVLDADEDTVTHDLAVVYFYRRAMEQALNPGAADVRAASADRGYAQDLVERNKAWLRGSDTQARLAALIGRRYDSRAPDGGTTVRVRRKKRGGGDA